MGQEKELSKLEQVITFNGFREDLQGILTGLPQAAKKDIEKNRKGSLDDLGSLLKIGDKETFTRTILRNPRLFCVLVTLHLCDTILPRYKEDLEEYYRNYRELIIGGKIPNPGGKEIRATTEITLYLKGVR